MCWCEQMHDNQNNMPEKSLKLKYEYIFTFFNNTFSSYWPVSQSIHSHDYTVHI